MIDSDLSLLDTGYYALMSVAFLYICTNPFIYATKFDAVRRTLLALAPCKCSQSDVEESAELDIRSRSAAAQRSGQRLTERISVGIDR